jgi:chromosome transmission fidelity protein 8
MPTTSITAADKSGADVSSPLPSLLHTPGGLALLELQATLHTPSSDSPAQEVGRLVFPSYDPEAGADDLAWTKRVYFYIGKNQRMTGSVKKLAKPLAVLRKADDSNDEGRTDLKILDIIKWKIVFSSRPVCPNQILGWRLTNMIGTSWR